MDKKTFINLWQPIDEESKQDGLDKDFIIDLNDLITSAVSEYLQDKLNDYDVGSLEYQIVEAIIKEK